MSEQNYEDRGVRLLLLDRAITACVAVGTLPAGSSINNVTFPELEKALKDGGFVRGDL